MSCVASCPVPSEWALFQKLLPPYLLNDLDPRGKTTVYTAWVVTWLLIYQRLHHNATLNDAVAELLLRFPPQALPDCKRVREGNLSANTGAYGQARIRLDARVLYWANEHIFDSLAETYPPSWKGRRAFLVDGSTLSLQPTPLLRAAYPPASNQYGPSAWPILHLAVAHELSSGLAVWPEFGPMYGPEAVAEVALARRLLPRLPARSVLLGDRNFGIFAFAHASVAEDHDVLLRLTRRRFEALKKKARQVGAGRWQLCWRPTRYDRLGHPHLPAEALVCGWLHEVKVSARLTLWLFTTLDATGQEMAALYHCRQDVETDLRDLKETLLVGMLSGKDAAVVEKELLAAVLAYNLATQVRRLASTRLGLEPRKLSFAGAWSLLQVFVTDLWQSTSPAAAEQAFERLLRMAGQRKVPQRKQERTYPREVLPRRRKFPERKRVQEKASP